MFISTDPVEQYWNLYSYCGGDPINLIDPDGQLAANVIGKIIGTAVGLTAGGIIGGLYAKNHGMDAINGIFPGMMIGGFAGFTAGAGIGYGIESGFFNQLGSVLTYGGSLSRYRDIWNAVNTASSIISAAQVASSADANDVSPQMLTPGYPGEMGGGNASSGGTYTAGMILPGDPSGLGPEWLLDPKHLDPNGSLYRDGGNNTLEFNKGRPGQKGWKGQDHWHYKGDHSKPGHLRPGAEIPDPVPQPKPRVRFWPIVGKTLRNVGYVGLLLLTLTLKDTPDPK
ncbi:MAG: hypothetical protein GX640_23770 [Fibrobacter sp.]|nr:hypothetical protein [Fibrobacter sp.]